LGACYSTSAWIAVPKTARLLKNAKHDWQKNTNRQRRHDIEAAQDTNSLDAYGLPYPCHNLQEEFDMVRDQPVHQTPSANLAITFNELEKLGQSLEVEEIRAHIMVAQVQVNEIQNPLPSHSSTSAHSHRCRHNGRGQH
jgi:hypothetical protein